MIEHSDETLLSAIPGYFCLNGLLKASPVEEAGERLLYFEASNEDTDYQNEIVLQKALAESAGYYLKYGNIDLSHYTIMAVDKRPANFMDFEIGKPIEVRVDGKQTFVKAQLYQGASPMAQNADRVWRSLTQQSPPSRWYPSVGGSVLSKSVRIDPVTGQKVAVIDKVLWNNIALDRTPVNLSVPEVSQVPVGMFAKCLGGFVIKALEAGHGTEVSALEGGAALRLESLYGKPYAFYQEQTAKLLRAGKIHPDRISFYLMDDYGFTPDEADQFTRQFFIELNKRKH